MVPFVLSNCAADETRRQTQIHYVHKSFLTEDLNILPKERKNIYKSFSSPAITCVGTLFPPLAKESTSQMTGAFFFCAADETRTLHVQYRLSIFLGRNSQATFSSL